MLCNKDETLFDDLQWQYAYKICVEYTNEPTRTFENGLVVLFGFFSVTGLLQTKGMPLIY